MNTFLRYKYYLLNPNKGKPSLDPGNIFSCYLFNIYYIIISITHFIAHCYSSYLLSFTLSLYYVITNFTIGVYLAGTTPMPPPIP